MSRPELGKPKTGQKVYVYERTNTGHDTIAAKITKVGRKLVTIETSGSTRVWRMRMDTQKQADAIGWTPWFATLDQFVYDQQHERAVEFLREQRNDVRQESPWFEPDRLIALAELIRAASGEKEAEVAW